MKNRIENVLMIPTFANLMKWTQVFAITLMIAGLSSQSKAEDACHEWPLLTASETKTEEPLTYLSRSIIPNFRRANEWLYRGGQPRLDKNALEILYYKFGVQKIINLIEADSPEMAQTIAKEKGKWKELTGREDSFVYIPLVGDYKTPAPKDKMFLIASQLKLAERAGEKVFIHCLGGRDRTGMAVANLRLLNGCGPTAALLEFTNRDLQPYRQGEQSLLDFTTERLMNSRGPSPKDGPPMIYSFFQFMSELKDQGPIYQKWKTHCPSCFP